MSSLGRTLMRNEIACPNCGGKRCSIHWEGGACDRCDGSGNWKERGENTCRSCDGGRKKPWVKCWKGGSYSLDASVAVNRPPLKPSSPRAKDERADLIYSAFLEGCYLSDDWRSHLQTERGLSDETIEQVGFITLPDQERCNALAAGLAKTYGPLIGVPGFYEVDGEWKFRRTLPPWESGLVIPYRNARGQVVMLQVRSNGSDPKKRYMCISGAPSFVSHAGTGSGAPCHWTPAVKAQTVGITEGGLKAIGIAHHWQRLGYYPVRWVGLCGLTVPADFLGQLQQAMPGVTQLLFAFDREVKGSDAWRAVERAKKTLRDGAAKWGMRVCEEPGCWKGGARKFDDYLRGRDGRTTTERFSD